MACSKILGRRKEGAALFHSPFDYLKHAHLARYHTLVLTCELWTYLADLNGQAWEWLAAIMEQMKAVEEVTEELKAREK